MAESRPSTEELLKKLDEQHQAYLETFRLVHEALLQTTSSTASPPASAPTRRRRRSTLDGDVERPMDRKAKTLHTSVISGDSDESDDDTELFVQTPLSSYNYDLEDLRQHLKTCRFDGPGSVLLESVVQSGKLVDPALFPEYPPEEKWHQSHYSVFDVGTDGAPLSRHQYVKEGTRSIDSAIWQVIQGLNSSPSSERPAVGRISIFREPNPVIFGALHLTMNQAFDMDELFGYLVNEDNTAAHITNRAFLSDPRQQKSIVFKFDYFTIVGEEVQPMPWQRTDDAEKLREKSYQHIRISRCSSVVALSLSGNPIKKLRNFSARRAKNQYGLVHDPWAPWHVLNIQCYPDHKHSMESHDPSHHFVNGPEAFLHTLLVEFKDAEKRFSDIYTQISRLVVPPADFMFNGELRDKLLFEDADFTYSRRYFWAYQTLGIMNNGIKAIIDAYDDTFTDEVWEGRHRTLWPMLEDETARNMYWKKRMAVLKKEFEKEKKKLEMLFEENDDRRKEIRTLRDQLFAGTSVLESRKSVELSAVTILQGHNIKLLTLVSIFFLPLTFVTSVFGMTNMSTEHQFKSFGITMATVCVPFFFLIGSLNTTSGMEFWRSKWHQFTTLISGHWKKYEKLSEGTDIRPPEHLRNRPRSLTSADAIQKRQEQLLPPKRSMTATTTTSNNAVEGAHTMANPQKPTAVGNLAILESGRKPTSPESSMEKSDETPGKSKPVPSLSFLERLMGRKKEVGERENDV